MDYALDINDPKIQYAMAQLHIQPTDLLLKDCSSFPGADKAQRLRYEHHLKRVQKLSKQVKNWIKSEKLAIEHKRMGSVQTELGHSRESSVTRIKEKFKLNLSVQIKIENKKRYLLNSSMQKLMRKEKLEEQRKVLLSRKIEKDLKRKENVERRIGDLMVSQRQRSKLLNEKFSRVSSRLSNLTPSSKKSDFSKSFSKDLHETFSHDKLKKIEDKLGRSTDLYQARIRDKTERLTDHNEKVTKTLRSQISLHEIRTHGKLLSLIEKSEGLEKHKNKKEQILNDSKLKKQAKKDQKHSKVQFNLEEEYLKMRKWVNKLENKSEMQKKVLVSQLAEMSKEQEFKALKKVLRDEDARENLARIKRESEKKREDLLEKYLENHRRFLLMKEMREKTNQKIRVEASLAKQEQMKAKMIHIMINRSDDPNEISKVINEKF